MPHQQFPLTAVPDGVLAGFALVALPPRKLGLVAMTCLQLKRCTDEVILQMARSKGLKRRDGESLCDLLFAMHVLFPPMMMPTATGPCVVACGHTHTAVVTSDGELHTFGNGDEGELGHREQSFFPVNVPKRVDALVGKRVVHVACGSHHTAVVTSDGDLFAFGDGDFGQLGHGGEDSEWVPRLVDALVGKLVVQVACGWYHTAVITSTGEVHTFGSGEEGPLGHGGHNNELVPRRVEALAERWVVQVSCGREHTAVVTSDGELHTFGMGALGRLGHGDEENKFVPTRVDKLMGKRVVQVSCGKQHTAVVTSEGDVFTFGAGFLGKLGHGGEDSEWVPRRVDALVGKRVVQVSCGYLYTAAVTSDGELFTFGDGRRGKLGHGGKHNELVPRRVEGGLTGKHVVQVECGYFHTAALTSDNELFTFGWGDSGRLGQGGTGDELVPRRVDVLT